MSSEVTKKVREGRERLGRAAEDGERLYRKRIHDPNGPTLADDNRIDGILTLDLTDALGTLDLALGEAERLREALELIAAADRNTAAWMQKTARAALLEAAE